MAIISSKKSAGDGANKKKPDDQAGKALSSQALADGIAMPSRAEQQKVRKAKISAKVKAKIGEEKGGKTDSAKSDPTKTDLLKGEARPTE